ncbi:MAG: ATP-dependent Clp protease adaptor ClpS [Saprospiraceae bacterium]|nr:ATP-dependent Clp protease adaptor ClpS [Saprospiraceae bacterium]MCB9310363.1 ATP-dependent Clp protease adaptor ClpS [Lewinellaceae bacterium]
MKIHFSLLGDTSFDEQEDVLVEEINSTGTISQLIVYNDDFNTFDWVIKCFIEVLHHSQEQSEQLSLLVHFKGKATVKTGPLDMLQPLKDALIDRGLSAVIESVADKKG